MRHLKHILHEARDVYRLTQTQQQVLAVVQVSQTPELAYNETMGEDSIYSARERLVDKGYLDITNDQLTLTDKGRGEVEAYGIALNGELTDYGKTLVGNVETN